MSVRTEGRAPNGAEAGLGAADDEAGTLPGSRGTVPPASPPEYAASGSQSASASLASPPARTEAVADDTAPLVVWKRRPRLWAEAPL